VAEFVNPYAFAPFADPPVRRAPAGHGALTAGSCSGALSVTLRARTPLLLGGFGPDGKQVPRRADGRLMIPGSGLLGAVRSVHEAMAGGCLRVIDRHYTPVHREPASSEVTKGLRLAMVLAVDAAGRPLRVSLCADEVWVFRELLAVPAGARPPATGDRLRYEGKPVSSAGRYVLTDGAVTVTAGLSAAEDGSWVLLVTDTQARDETKPAYFAAGRPGDGVAAVTDRAWASYLRRVDGTRDMQRLRQARRDDDGRHGARHRPGDEPVPDQFVDVLWPPPNEETPEADAAVIGRRLAVRPYLRVGQPVWVRLIGPELAQQVTEIRPALLWRSEGRIPVAERVGQAGPCEEADRLCWSCRIFGSADVAGRGDEVSVQQAYRGHVRVEDAEVVGDSSPGLVQWELAPLASPKPSAGQFYLTGPASAAGRMAKADDPLGPAATWGSIADPAGQVRRIAGRKFYWRTADPTGGEQPRGRARRHQSGEMTRSVELVPAGAELSTRVAFDNLRLADLGSLVAALDPRRLWSVTGEHGDYVISVGGGKPFGFGSVTATVELTQLDTARSRYLGEAGDGLAAEDSSGEEVLDEAVRAFLAEVPAAVSGRWAALRHLVTLGYVPDDLVWYPPGSGSKGEAKYDRGFDFWRLTSGVQLSKERRPLVGLPDPARGPDRQVLSTPERSKPEQGTKRDRDPDRGRR
jgi:CRISPR/Cas system CSM-associated protein Csm3 (group 7 of RAMP superfamily)